MRITIESTSKIVQLIPSDGKIPVQAVPARIWEGRTETGVPVQCYVTRIAVPEGRQPEDYRDFEHQLTECKKPSPDVEAIPLRLIL